MAAPAAEAPPAPGGLPAGAGGGGGAQILQQIEGLLAQLTQMSPQPEVVQAVAHLAPQIEALQQVIGKSEEGDMSSGLANPGGAPGGAPAPGGMPPMPGGAPGGAAPEEVPQSTSFDGANKAAMALMKSHGSFSKSTPKGEKPSTSKTKNKAKMAEKDKSKS